MTRTLITQDQKDQIEAAYFKGAKPGEIAQELGLKPATVRQHLHRSALTRRKAVFTAQVDAVTAQTGTQVIEEFRQRHREQLGQVVNNLGDAALKGSGKLVRLWDALNAPAEAVSAARAGSLILDTTYRLHGISQGRDEPEHPSIHLFMVRGEPINRDMKQVDFVVEGADPKAN